MTALAPWLSRFEAARAAALNGDVEALHHARTIARRLRVWLRLAGWRALESDLRWVCRETSRVRDLDVLDTVLTPAARAAWRPAARRQASAALSSQRVDGVLRALAALPPLDVARARKRLDRWERALEHPRPKTDDEVHALRKRVRRARYAREWLGDDAADLRALQDVLGVACDLAALRRLLT